MKYGKHVGRFGFSHAGNSVAKLIRINAIWYSFGVSMSELRPRIMYRRRERIGGRNDEIGGPQQKADANLP